jgi:RimJ/RimL family protein N-acetyltransferase
MESLPSSLESARLRLDPLRVEDAPEMTGVLSDPGLYEFIGGEPPTETPLSEQYEAQTVGASPDGRQDWLNWIVRLTATDTAIGYTQATVDRETGTAELAWVIGVPWQGQGYAVEAVTLTADGLRQAGVRRLIAHVHPEHPASQRVADHAGLMVSERVVDGEIEWEWP